MLTLLKGMKSDQAMLLTLHKCSAIVPLCNNVLATLVPGVPDPKNLIVIKLLIFVAAMWVLLLDLCK